MPAPSMPSTFTRRRRSALGESVLRPDGPPKVKGEFAFSSDLYVDGMVWGKTVRSPYPYARIVEIDISGALAMPGVHAVVTQDDLWGARTYGLEHHDQPVFADDVVRFHGEPIAAVAADHPELAARACAAIRIEYEVLDPLVDPEAAITAPPIHPDGNVFRYIALRHGDPQATGDVVVEGDYEVGMQDQAFLGPESGLAVPSDDGGVELFVATQWLHVDRDQIAACLNLPREKVRLSLAGTGGAFGGREDLSMQIHACLLALVTRRPVKMVYSREESFFGHVHRHPARLWYRHHARRDGTLVNVECRMVFDGGAYTSSSTAVISNATSFAAGPVLRAQRDGGRLRGADEQPALRGDAGLRCGADVLRRRGADGQARRRARHGPGRAAAEERAEDARPAAHRAGHHRHRTGGRVHPGLHGAADAAAPGPGRRPDEPARRGRPHRARPQRAARHRVRGRVQEPGVLRGLRRLLLRPGPARARGRRRAGGHRARRHRGGGPGLRHARPADRPGGARRRHDRAAPGGHPGRLGRLHQRLAADHDERRRGADGLRRCPRGDPRAGRARPAPRAGRPGARRRGADDQGRDAQRVARRRPAGRARRGLPRVPPRAHRPPRRERAGQRALVVRVRGAPGGGRRRRGARAWSGSCRSPPRRTSARRSTRWR